MVNWLKLIRQLPKRAHSDARWLRAKDFDACLLTMPYWISMNVKYDGISQYFWIMGRKVRREPEID